MRFWHLCSFLIGVNAALAIRSIERGEYAAAVLWVCGAFLWAHAAYEADK